MEKTSKVWVVRHRYWERSIYSGESREVVKIYGVFDAEEKADSAIAEEMSDENFRKWNELFKTQKTLNEGGVALD